MRVACLTHYYIEDNRAGGELMLHALLSALASAGHAVNAYITDTRLPNTTIDGVSVVYGVDPASVLDSVESDIVVSQFQNGDWTLGHAKRKQKPMVYIVHNDMWRTSRLVNSLTPRDLVVYNSDWIKRANRTTASEVVVHPPIDRRAYKTKTTGEYVTLVNLTLPKGVDIFISLAKLMPDVKFLGVLGGYWKSDQVREIALDNVTIIENTPNMRDDVYAKTKVLLMPSSYESFGMVAAEAITSGIPVIASPTPGLVENLGDAGVYVRRGGQDTRYWHEALKRLLTDGAYYKEVSNKSIARSKVIDSKTELKAFVKAVEDLVNADI